MTEALVQTILQMGVTNYQPLRTYAICTFPVTTVHKRHRQMDRRTGKRLCIPRRTLWRYTNVVLLLLLLLASWHKREMYILHLALKTMTVTCTI